MRESGGCATFVRKDTVVIDGVCGVRIVCPTCCK